MKIFIVGSKHLYHHIEDVKSELESLGHIITLPNCYDDPLTEERMKNLGKEDHIKFKSEMFLEQERKVKANDAILVMNYEKHNHKNYVGGSTFLEMFKAFELGKKIFLMNPIPGNILKDEIEGFSPIIINQDLSLKK